MLVRVQNSSLLLLRQSPSNAGQQYMSRLLSIKTMKQQTMKTKTTARNGVLHALVQKRLGRRTYVPSNALCPANELRALDKMLTDLVNGKKFPRSNVSLAASARSQQRKP
jgi:hypothetical protein